MELVGIDYLRQKLSSRQKRIDERYKYYEMKKTPMDFGIFTPPKLMNFKRVNGWCSKSVDALADRLSIQKFKNDYFGMWDYFKNNNHDILFDSAILSALICSCSFIYLYKDDFDNVKMQVIDGGKATGIIDDTTRFLKEGYAILDTDHYGIPTKEAYFTSDYTEFYERDKEPYRVDNPALYPLLVPVVYRPDAKRPFGHSRISRDCMDYQDAASRTLKKLSISEEYYSVPQKYALGIDDDVEVNNWVASASAMLAIGKSEDGTMPQIGSFAQMSISSFMDSIKVQASLFAGATGLTLDDLGFPTANPASDDAIKLQHAELTRTAKKAQKSFATGFLNAGFLASCLENDMAFTRDRIADTKIIWEPLFEPGASTLSAIGDGVSKINSAISGYIGKDELHQLTGIKGSDD